MSEITKLNWVGRSKNYVSGKGIADVRIAIHHRGSEKLAGVFTFYDGCYKLFAKGDYAQVAVYKNRVFFRSADINEGIKLVTNSNCATDIRCLKFYDDNLSAALIAFEGTYEMKYDEFYELYYIEKVGE